MDANTITAICATGIAVASLAVSVTETTASRRHNRQSVRPLLQFEYRRLDGGETGVRLSNHGLGPAIVTGTTLTLDGAVLGPWEEPELSLLRRPLPIRPRVRALSEGKILPAGFSDFLLYLPDYRAEADAWFWDLIRRRMRIEVRYESLYGRDEQRAVSALPYSGEKPRPSAPAGPREQ
ncbi:hypothetical protein ACSNN9_25200 [Micromonospora sp. URMC 107]|uniref:hypothetical protein n=1 Tax=Micromonospora sp. URMC 107 TaxID=3423418 RepID=UPI003F1D7A86